MYSDARFPPVDAFHAWCMQDAKVLFDATEKNITKIHLELQYAPDDLEISRILWVDQVIANYRIEYDRVIFDIDSPVLNWATPLFHLNFESKGTALQTDILVATWSYFVTNGKITYLQEKFPLTFAQVPECTPDIVPPSVNLIFPKDPEAKISLDQYFVFEIKDADKWVDKNSIRVFLNDQVYTVANTENLKWKGNYLSFYPQDWLAVNKKINLQISVGDLQSYGGANTTEKLFSFKTAPGLALLDNIDPMTLRTYARNATQMAGTPEECLLLQNFYARSDASFQSGLDTILQKLSCTIKTVAGNEDIFGDTSTVTPNKTSKLSFVSVFAVLGRILFVIALILKFHYMASYKKHKKLAQSLKPKA